MRVAWRLLVASAVVVGGSVALEALGWTYDELAWPLDMIVVLPIMVTVGALLAPELERRINRRRGRPTT